MEEARAIFPRHAARVRASRRPAALLSVWLLATAGLAWAEPDADDAEGLLRLVERVIDGDTLVLEGGELGKALHQLLEFLGDGQELDREALTRGADNPSLQFDGGCRA